MKKSRNKSVRAIMHKPDQDTIYECEKKLEQALNAFQLSTEINNAVILRKLKEKFLGPDSEDLNRDRERVQTVQNTKALLEIDEMKKKAESRDKGKEMGSKREQKATEGMDRVLDKVGMYRGAGSSRGQVGGDIGRIVRLGTDL